MRIKSQSAIHQLAPLIIIAHIFIFSLRILLLNLLNYIVQCTQYKNREQIKVKKFNLNE